ncbi:hypothetical protein [Paraburkholderia dilworthii]|uniref:Uncharacterized protein n=1 Tax=Paraburkholderia dilworthii TaxID=948106 RepID=A0ABW9D699_9BURK
MKETRDVFKGIRFSERPAILASAICTTRCDRLLFSSWPFAQAHPGLMFLVFAVMVIAVLAGLLCLAGGAFALVYNLDKFFVGEVWGNRRPRTDRSVDPTRIEAATRTMRRVADDLARTAQHAPEPPPASKPWAWLVPMSDLWFDRCGEWDGDRKRAIVTPQARAVFAAWADATQTKRSSTHHAARKALYEDYVYFVYEVFMGGRDEAATLLPPRQFWPLVRERFGVRETTYGHEARWHNHHRTVPVSSATVPPLYDSTPSALRIVAEQAMAETATIAPAARARMRL